MCNNEADLKGIMVNEQSPGDPSFVIPFMWHSPNDINEVGSRV